MAETATRNQAAETEEAHYPCPACEARLFGWVVARHPLDGSRIVLDRCESCGLAVTRAPEPPEPGDELERFEATNGAGSITIEAPNRRSLQGSLGGGQWAGLEPDRRRLHLTPRSVELLLGIRDYSLVRTRFPFTLRGYLGMLQTMVNAFTFRDNFARNALSGRLRPRTARERAAFALDTVVSVLVAAPMAVLALPLELVGATLRRSGVMVAEAKPRFDSPGGPGRTPG